MGCVTKGPVGGFNVDSTAPLYSLTTLHLAQGAIRPSVIWRRFPHRGTLPIGIICATPESTSGLVRSGQAIVKMARRFVLTRDVPVSFVLDILIRALGADL
jgi:hypothetical protein